MVDIVLKSTLVLAATTLLSLAIRQRAAASVRHATWITGLVLALCIPALGIIVPQWQLPLLTTPGVIAASRGHWTPPVVPGVPGVDDRGVAETSLPVPRGDSLPMASGQPNALARWLALAPSTIVTLWLTGTMLLVLRVLFAGYVARRVAAAHVPGPAPWLVTARHLAQALGVTRRVRFVRSSRVTMPMACGLFRPAVVLPMEVDAWPEARATAVLLHELAHVRRRDCLTQTVADLVVAVYWFNPLAWVAASAIRRERERACDDAVLAAGTPASEYASHLLDVARAARPSGLIFGVTAGVAMAHRSELEGRLMAILDDTLPRRGVTARIALVATVLVAGVAVPLAALDPWSRPVAPAAVVAAPPARGFVVPAATPIDTPRAEAAPEQAAPVGAVRDAATHAEATDSMRSAARQPTPTPSPSPSPTPSPRVAMVSGPAGQSGREGRQANDAVVAALAGALGDEDAGVRRQAAHALSQQNHAEAQKALAGLLNDPDDDLRQLAVFSLARMGDSRSFEPLSAALKDTNASVRQQAAFGLAQLRDPRAVAALSTALADTDASVRQQAAFALGRLGAAEAVDALLIAAKDPEADVRQQALFALGQIGDPRAQDVAIAALKDSSKDVRGMAAFALMRLANK